jgi:flagellar protein FliO/FliZ
MKKRLICIAVFSTSAFAESNKMGLSNDLISMSLSLFLVLGLIVGMAILLKRLNPSLGNSPDFKVVRSFPLGNRERLMVIELDGKHHLLGVTSQNINYLYQLETPLSEQNAPAFAKELSRFMMPTHKKNKADD